MCHGETDIVTRLPVVAVQPRRSSVCLIAGAVMCPLTACRCAFEQDTYLLPLAVLQLVPDNGVN